MSVRNAVDQAVEELGIKTKPKNIIKYIHDFIDPNLDERDIHFTYYRFRSGYPLKHKHK